MRYLNGARPTTLEKSAMAFSIPGAGQQKVPEEKKEILPAHFSSNPGVQQAGAKTEHTQEIDETFVKNFNGIGLS